MSQPYIGAYHPTADPSAYSTYPSAYISAYISAYHPTANHSAYSAYPSAYPSAVVPALQWGQ